MMNAIVPGRAGSFEAAHETMRESLYPVLNAAFGNEGRNRTWRHEVRDIFLRNNCIPPWRRAEYIEALKCWGPSDRGRTGYVPDAAIDTALGRTAIVEYKNMQFNNNNCVIGFRRGGVQNAKRPVDVYAERCIARTARKIAAADAQWCTNLDGSPMLTGTYLGERCGPMLALFGRHRKLFFVTGPQGEISRDANSLITQLADKISPESVRLWHLEGEAGARAEVKGVIKFIIYRRLAGATFRARADMLLNRVHALFGGGLPKGEGWSNAPRPGFSSRHTRGHECGYDGFDDAFSRFAGRSSWRSDFDPERL